MGTDYDELVRLLELAAVADRDPTRRRKAQGILVAVTAVEGTRRVLDHLIAPTTGDGGLFDALTPARVAEAMLYPQRYLFDVDPDGLEVFPVLATELAAYLRERRSGKVLPVPSEAELEEHFSLFAPVIAAAWPVASIVAEVVSLRCSQPTDLAHREAVLMHSARASCLLRDPPEIGREYYDEQIKRIAGREAEKWKLAPEVIVADVRAHLEEKAHQGLLGYNAAAGAQFFAYWSAAVRNASIDMLDRRERASDPERPARSTRWKYRKEGVADADGPARKRLGHTRRAHRDPTKQTKTLGQIAEEQGRHLTTVRRALKAVEAARSRNAPKVRRGRGKVEVYALDADWENAVVDALPPEDDLTLEAAARELDVSADDLFRLIERKWSAFRTADGRELFPERQEITIPRNMLKVLRAWISPD